MVTKKKKDVDEGNVSKKKTPARNAAHNAAGGTKSTKSQKSDNVSLFTLAVVAILILGVVGVVFGYTKDQISQIQKGGTEVLENEVDVLRAELADLNKKTKTLEEENAQNKEIVVNLFDKNRELPSDITVEGWAVYNNEEALLSLKTPSYWEIESANRVMKETETSDDGEEIESSEPEEFVIFLQPQNDTDFNRSITVRDDYVNLWSLSLDQKYDIFSELDLLDEVDFSFGKMLYFIDLDNDDNQIPTILVLTEDRILRNTFNVYNKTLKNYIKYRIDFESIMVNFEFLEVAEIALEEEPTEETTDTE